MPKATHDLQQRAMGLESGDDIRVNDGDVLTVGGSHQREISKRVRRARGVGKYRTIVRLRGDSGDDYHLVCTVKSRHPPVLYHESEWTHDNSRPKHTTHYSGSGERVETLEINP